MEKDKNIIIGGIVILALILIVWNMSKNPNGSEIIPTNNEVTNPTKTQVKTPVAPNPVTSLPNNTNTFPAIFNQAGSHQCTYDQVSASSVSTNNIYIAGGKMRGEFRTTTGAITTASLMVYNSGILYVWQEGKSTGTKTVLKSVADLPVVIPKDLTSGAIINSGSNSVGWNCYNWIKDNSLLSPPSYVKFY